MPIDETWFQLTKTYFNWWQGILDENNWYNANQYIILSEKFVLKSIVIDESEKKITQLKILGTNNEVIKLTINYWWQLLTIGIK